ncbi:hypothetical protein J7L84_01575 [Candidatus Bipolaricaulota bacterium]|nr:hypothetical protein [Candidatus Bipolaricaulota bacterium]
METSYLGEAAGPVVVGIGINVNNPIPEELKGMAISLQEVLGRELELEAVLQAVLAAIGTLLV